MADVEITQGAKEPADKSKLADDLDSALRSALRFAASRSAITSKQEKAILTALRQPSQQAEIDLPHPITDELIAGIGRGQVDAQGQAMDILEAIKNGAQQAEIDRLRDLLRDAHGTLALLYGVVLAVDKDGLTEQAQEMLDVAPLINRISQALGDA